MKRNYTIYIKVFIILVSGLVYSGCSSLFRQPVKTSEARLGANSEVYEELTSLPDPKEKVVAAVYKFRDQTGQYKTSETGASWSTAVTQGATSILIEAMEESGWFIPIEREGLGNLLNERKIIRSSRSAYLQQNGSDESLLPPLLFAGIILEGGIISFDSNILTGGAGLRYFGAGASGEYREDRVSIYLRAVSTSNGRILKTVYTSKRILSQKLDVGLFRFVKFKRLLETETGYTFNEPSEIAVREAIDKAVYALIVEGIIDGLWELKNYDDINSNAVQAYMLEKELNDETNYLGYRSTDRRGFTKLGLNAGGIIYDGDYPNSVTKPSWEFIFGLWQNRTLMVDWRFGSGHLECQDYFASYISYTGLNLRYNIYKDYPYTPYIVLGSGLIFENQDKFLKINSEKGAFPYLYTSAGFEYLLTKRIGLDIGIDYSLFFNDRFDDIEQGKYNDYFWNIKAGFNFYF